MIGLAHAAVSLVARELREHLAQPTTRLRLRAAAVGIGVAGEEMEHVIARWQAMLVRRETEEGPLTGRGES